MVRRPFFINAGLNERWITLGEHILISNHKKK